MGNIQTVIKGSAMTALKTLTEAAMTARATMLRGSAAMLASAAKVPVLSTSAALLLLAAAGLTLAGCQRMELQEEQAARIECGEDFVVTATIAEPEEDETTKLTFGEDSDHYLHPRWSVGDNVVGWDADGNTYGLTVTRIKNEGRSAIMNLITSGDYAGSFTGGTLADGTLIHLVYAPGKKPKTDVTSNQLVVDLASQDADKTYALMSSSAIVVNNGTATSMSAVFHNKVALLVIRRPVMGDMLRAYTALKVSGPTSTTLSTKVTFSISDGGGLKATYDTPGVITKAVSFTSSAAGDGPEGPFYIALCPLTSSTALTLSTGNCEVCSVKATTYPAGTWHYVLNPSFGHPWVEIAGVKWATMNVGAIGEAGDYATCAGDWFAWGATQPWYTGISSWSGATPSFSGWISGKSAGYANDNSNTPYYSGSAFTKYNDSDHLTDLDTGDDAATANWGNGWRMPTKEEFAALYEACGGSGTSWTGTISDAISLAGTVQSKGVYWCTDVDGVAGALFSDGSNQVFFPAAGTFSGTALSNTGGTSNHYYQSSSLYTASTKNACNLRFSSSDNIISASNCNDRYNGHSVRPVVNELTRYSGDEVDVIPDGALPGVFTVAAGDLGGQVRVRFSKGNLQATYNGSSYTWAFAANQYDYVGNAAGNTTIDSQTDGAVVDLFGWTAEGKYSDGIKQYGINTSVTNSDYGSSTSDALSDWGGLMGSIWRTLTGDSDGEWKYLLDTRSASTVGGTANARYAKATVCGTAGLIIFPDVYTHPDGVTAPTKINTPGAAFTVNTYDSSAWAKMEAAGAVFLPTGGYRSGSTIVDAGSYGLCWSSTPASSRSDFASDVSFSGSDFITAGSYNRCDGRSVRLVTPAD